MSLKFKKRVLKYKLKWFDWYSSHASHSQLNLAPDISKSHFANQKIGAQSRLPLMSKPSSLHYFRREVQKHPQTSGCENVRVKAKAFNAVIEGGNAITQTSESHHKHWYFMFRWQLSTPASNITNNDDGKSSTDPQQLVRIARLNG